MSRKAAFVLVLGCLVIAGAAYQAKAIDVTGDWEFAMVGGPAGGPPEGGDRPAMIITFVQKGEALEAKMNNPMGEEMKGKGKIVGNVIEFSFTMAGPDGEMTIVHKGMVDGDAMKGTISMGEMGDMEWSAKRVVKK